MRPPDYPKQLGKKYAEAKKLWLKYNAKVAEVKDLWAKTIGSLEKGFTLPAILNAKPEKKRKMSPEALRAIRAGQKKRRLREKTEKKAGK